CASTVPLVASARAATPAFAAIPAAQSNEPAVRCIDVGKDFWVRRGMVKRDRLVALGDIALDVQQGESVAVVGESGSAPSTLLRVVAGLIEADRGKVVVTGKPQMVFQDAGASLTPWLTVGEIVGERLRKTTRRRERD